MADPFAANPDSSVSLSVHEKHVLEKLGVPLPRLCPTMRRRRRLSWRNDRHLYRRRCDATGKTLLSIHSEQAAFPVYDKDYWWTDAWDPVSYGREFDFSRPFFEQFHELQNVVPRPALNVIGNENCDYVTQCAYSKNCYLSFNTDYCEGCLYCTNVIRSRDCIDCLNLERCELCYECIDCVGCYSSSYLRDCQNCHDCYLLKNCSGCHSCMGSVNLRNKEYYYFNKRYSPAQYAELIVKHRLNTWSGTTDAQQLLQRVVENGVFAHAEIHHCENAIGDYLSHCKDAYYCFDCFSSRDITHCTTVSNAQDVADFDIGAYDAELCYEVVSSGDRMLRCFWSSNIWGQAEDIQYSDLIVRARHCFGCVCLRDNEFCILNRKYSAEDYARLRRRIVEHMMQTGEWGEFFPAKLSPFPYNRSVVAEFFPLSEEEAIALGLRWENEPPIASVQGSPYPEETGDKLDELSQSTFACEQTGKAFRLQRVELEFYLKQGLALPRLCPEMRHKRRREARNPRQLWPRCCAKCHKVLLSTYAPERKETIVCLNCYPDYLE